MHMIDAEPHVLARPKKRLIGVLVFLVVVPMVVLGVVAFRSARAFHCGKVRQALKTPPVLYSELESGFGFLTDIDPFIGGPDHGGGDVLGLLNHPATREKVTWIEGRGGATAVTHARIWSVPETEADYWEERREKEYGWVFLLDSNDRLIGWIEYGELLDPVWASIMELGQKLAAEPEASDAH